MDDIRRFCEVQKHLLPWLGSFNWEDIKGNRLSFNPYCYLPEYNEAENSIMYFYSIGNKTPFQKFIQNMNQNMTLTAKLSLTGLFFVRLHALRASRERQHSEKRSEKFLIQELAGINLPDLLKPIATNILSNKQPFLKINSPEINNTELLIKSVIAHIIIFHASVEPNSSQLAIPYHSVRYMTPTSYRILHLIVHALIGASAPPTALAFLQKNDQTATDSENYCMDHIRNDWEFEMLKKLLNCSDANLALMFHSLISSMMENPSYEISKQKSKK
ncbi:unnamed protein product [Rhizophagus irregularis]|nr:unnamed protein product [Rhizophagus irregularis]CAB4443915.1 unnamed protein product [Rhizophagus irregularis]